MSAAAAKLFCGVNPFYEHMPTRGRVGKICRTDIVTYKGETKTIEEIVAQQGIHWTTYRNRRNSGLTIEESLNPNRLNKK